jgi:hypothetical protein
MFNDLRLANLDKSLRKRAAASKVPQFALGDEESYDGNSREDTPIHRCPWNRMSTCLVGSVTELTSLLIRLRKRLWHAYSGRTRQYKRLFSE